MTTTGTTSPVRANFPMRRMDSSFSETPKYWWDDQPFMTQFVNSLSSLFLYGEKFFVDSMRAVRDRLEDPQLRRDINAFIDQETMYSKGHATYSEYAEEHEVDLECLELRIKVLLESVGKVTTRKHQLAIAYALEHFTAAMAAQLLKHEGLTTQIQSPKMYKLQMWHAIGGNGHKNVAYDVYQKVYGGYLIRVLVIMLTTLVFFGVIGWSQLDLLRKDGQLFNWRSWEHSLGTLFGLHKGFFTRLLLPYPDHYRPDFHPSDYDTAKLEKYWKNKLAFAD